jgi:hypothetical protein
VRTHIGLTLNSLTRTNGYFDKVDHHKAVVHADALAYVHERTDDSVWAPSWHLTESELSLLIIEARALRTRSAGITSESVTAAIKALDFKEKTRCLAENTLLLLAQFQHGTSLDSVLATSLIPLVNGETGCWALVTVNKNTIDVRVRSGDRSGFQTGTGKLLALLDVVENDGHIRHRQDISYVLRIRPGLDHAIRMSHKDGSPVGQYKVSVLGPGGRLLDALWQPLPRTLWSVGIILGGLSALLQFITIMSFPTNPNLWFEWWHDLVDRVFTTVLWAAAFATLQGLQRVGPRWRTTRGGQVRIEW